VSLTAGLATIEVLRNEKVHEKLNGMGDSLRTQLRSVVADKGLDYTVSGIGSMFKVFFGGEVHNYQDALKCDKERYKQFFHRMHNDGIFLPPSQFETNFLSHAHTQEDIEKLLGAYEVNLS